MVTTRLCFLYLNVFATNKGTGLHNSDETNKNEITCKKFKIVIYAVIYDWSGKIFVYFAWF